MISASGRLYAVFTAPGAKFDESRRQGNTADASGQIVRSLCGDAEFRRSARFAQCAYSIPRDSRMDWSYDARRGKVTTTWTVKTEPLLAGKADVVLQGWLAHHWRGAAGDAKLTGPEYLTPRGPLRTSLGNAFQWVYDFDGFLPNLPAPQPAAATQSTPLRSAANGPTSGLLRR